MPQILPQIYPEGSRITNEHPPGLVPTFQGFQGLESLQDNLALQTQAMPSKTIANAWTYRYNYVYLYIYIVTEGW